MFWGPRGFFSFGLFLSLSLPNILTQRGRNSLARGLLKSPHFYWGSAAAAAENFCAITDEDLLRHGE